MAGRSQDRWLGFIVRALTIADIAYVAIATGFVYLAAVLDAWPRRVVGHALGRSLDARLAVAALDRAIALRRPLPGCLFHSDRGAQYAFGTHRARLAAHGFVGSMGRRGNLHDNSQAESFLKTLKAEEVHRADHAAFEDVAARLPRFIEGTCNARRLHSALCYPSPRQFGDRPPPSLRRSRQNETLTCPRGWRAACRGNTVRHREL